MLIDTEMLKESIEKEFDLRKDFVENNENISENKRKSLLFLNECERTNEIAQVETFEHRVSKLMEESLVVIEV